MSNKGKRHFLTMEQKIEILTTLDKGETSVSLARLYNIGKATVTGIKNDRHAIMDFASKMVMDSGDGIKRRKVMEVAKYQDLNIKDQDKAMEMWFIQKRSLIEPISSLQNEESDDSSSDKSMGTPKGPTSVEAFAAYETGLE
ncbi:DNA binding HTH domain, Psq-type,Homeobox domain-like,Winged helix-turn-helix DNA-binding domain [Cinara cedri]|uniref:DNA binding HTH domain, Psq-type,Homeobox domain-like,Winged helix-turn-helix DNA-binding domain n=1 Tax=Cinara cedri TaxID=506608 RepID=A0A5E4MWB6_9HEMI|nr:DNA binding HTH domain, Psq-type,Homeobox domain-like,Winged helix-turn-helix DNA-binding domain [Cinara cedri]